MANEIEQIGERSSCGDAPSNIDTILTEISNLHSFTGLKSGENFILKLEKILNQEKTGLSKDFNRRYLLDIWEKAGGQKGLLNPCNEDAKENQILFCKDNVECRVEDWTHYLFDHKS